MKKDECFGELGFYTDNPRCATVKSRDFNELFAIDSEIFLEIAEPFPEVMMLYHQTRARLIEDADYSVLNLECYVCRQLGHIAIDCN